MQCKSPKVVESYPPTALCQPERYTGSEQHAGLQARSTTPPPEKKKKNRSAHRIIPVDNIGAMIPRHVARCISIMLAGHISAMSRKIGAIFSTTNESAIYVLPRRDRARLLLLHGWAPCLSRVACQDCGGYAAYAHTRRLRSTHTPGAETHMHACMHAPKAGMTESHQTTLEGWSSVHISAASGHTFSGWNHVNLPRRGLLQTKKQLDAK